MCNNIMFIFVCGKMIVARSSIKHPLRFHIGDSALADMMSAAVTTYGLYSWRKAYITRLWLTWANLLSKSFDPSLFWLLLYDHWPAHRYDPERHGAEKFYSFTSVTGRSSAWLSVCYALSNHLPEGICQQTAHCACGVCHSYGLTRLLNKAYIFCYHTSIMKSAIALWWISYNAFLQIGIQLA